MDYFVVIVIAFCLGMVFMHLITPDRGAEGDEDQGLDGK